MDMSRSMNKLRNAAAEVNNLEFLGFVPYKEVNGYYQRAKLFVNTSYTEGFPNSFLQSWVRGTPVVSFFDPDGLIDKKYLGKSVTDLDEMQRTIKSLLDNEQEYSQISVNSIEYATKHHAADSISTEYIQNIENINLNKANE